jgi:hypothetical protein
MLKRKSAAARPALKPRKTARKTVIEGQVRTNVVIDRELVVPREETRWCGARLPTRSSAKSWTCASRPAG